MYRKVNKGNQWLKNLDLLVTIGIIGLYVLLGELIYGNLHPVGDGVFNVLLLLF